MNSTNELFEFITASPTAFHAADNIARTLEAAGFTRLYEEDEWQLGSGDYYVMRGGSSVIAFRIPDSFRGFNIIAAHTDSPSFKLKENASLNGVYARLNTEKYGGMLMSTWFDRPLGIAGRITYKKDNKIISSLYDSERSVCIIPSVAPHLDRESSNGKKLNPQTDLLPLIGANGTSLHLPDGFISVDLYLYNRQAPCVFGLENEYIGAPRIDDLQCVYGALYGFLDSHGSENVSVLCALDNEEVGSESRQGADSDFLESIIRRISGDKYYTALANSFLISADNAHAVHPNHPELSDESNRPTLNSGIVIKHNANMRYTTDSQSAAIVSELCDAANIPHQEYANRSDIPGGSTLGNIALTHTSVRAADIGLAQLAMHSAYETAGAKDTQYMRDFATKFYNTTIITEKDSLILK